MHTGDSQVETVEDCMTGTQTSFRVRQKNSYMVFSQPRNTLADFHAVNAEKLVVLEIGIEGICMDMGKMSMRALALGNTETQSLYQLQAEAITKALEVDRAQYNLRYDSI